MVPYFAESEITSYVPIPPKKNMNGFSIASSPRDILSTPKEGRKKGGTLEAKIPVPAGEPTLNSIRHSADWAAGGEAMARGEDYIGG